MATVKNLLIFLSAAAVAFWAILLYPTLNIRWRWDEASAADMVVMNATIYTSDPSLPFVEAFAVRNGRILRVGNYSSMKMNRVELRGVKGQDDFIRKVKEAMRGKLPGEWILGGGWNNDMWGGDLPIASWIDDVTPNNPEKLERLTFHYITTEPTGLLVDSAMKLLLAVIPDVSINDRRDALIRASKYALMRGVTTIVDLGRYFPGESVDHVWHDLSGMHRGHPCASVVDGSYLSLLTKVLSLLDVYRWADSAGRMLIRVCLFFPLQTWSSLADLIQESGKAISNWLYLGGVKAFADGSLGSNSALFYEVAIHAIGDKANDLVLDLYHSVVSSNGIRDRRFRIEHVQHLMPATVARFGQQRVIASVQPDHLLDDADSAEKKIGAIRAQTGSYMFQSLLSSGTLIAFGSDWPVSDINPLRSIKTALTRRPPGWDTAWIPSERIALEDALNAYTISAAYAIFLDHEVGSLTPGKYADFVVLPSTSWEEFAEDVPSTVFKTYINGVQAYP
ncbi:hypothetical protein J5N97_014254 [Dioscorea zingiberensis]|uniref:Amidohydrolase 3 domain-containing protein n=1 Tax=Dioscorea zingiberensis TaxID=325984 RepID=A0A9D5HJC1_9LILI|nr:hypothetical protein J5N97_014254 [Dioscorea zingiberensis]